MKILGKILPGHGVASGKGGDKRYPEGTLKLQAPHFFKRGLDLSVYFSGTINLDVSPYKFNVGLAKHFFESVDWSDHIPPENFYFFDLEVWYKGREYTGLIYMPDPETKTDHEQKASVLELILPKVEGLAYGDTAEIEVPEEQISFYTP